MNQLQEQFYQMMARLRGSSSKVASTVPPEPREWSLDKNGVIVSKPIKSKVASVTPRDINKVRVIADFLNAKRY